MIEHIFIGGELIYTGKRLSLGVFDPPFNYVFYSTKTGEVWGQRIAVSDEPPVWHYISDSFPCLTLPYEEAQGYIPVPLLEFYLKHMEKSNGSTSRQ